MIGVILFVRSLAFQKEKGRARSQEDRRRGSTGNAQGKGARGALNIHSLVSALSVRRARPVCAQRITVFCFRERVCRHRRRRCLVTQYAKQASRRRRSIWSWREGELRRSTCGVYLMPLSRHNALMDGWMDGWSLEESDRWADDGVEDKKYTYYSEASVRPL